MSLWPVNSMRWCDVVKELQKKFSGTWVKTCFLCQEVECTSGANKSWHYWNPMWPQLLFSVREESIAFLQPTEGEGVLHSKLNLHCHAGLGFLNNLCRKFPEKKWLLGNWFIIWRLNWRWAHLKCCWQMSCSSLGLFSWCIMISLPGSYLLSGL